MRLRNVGVCGLAGGVAGGLAGFLMTSLGSDYLTVERDVTGELVKVSSDGVALSLATEDGELATRIVNAGQFSMEPGDTVTGTVVSIPLEDGAEEALVIYSVE